MLSETCPRQGRCGRRCPTVNGSTFPRYPTDPLRLTPVTGRGTDTTTTQHEKTCSSFTCAEARYIEQIDTRNTGFFNHEKVWLLRAVGSINSLSNFLHFTQPENFACISLSYYRRNFNELPFLRDLLWTVYFGKAYYQNHDKHGRKNRSNQTKYDFKLCGQPLRFQYTVTGDLLHLNRRQANRLRAKKRY